MLDRNKDQPSSQVWNLMTSFRINLDQERSLILKEQDSLKKQLAHLSDSINTLQDLKRKVEAINRQQRLMKDLETDD